MEHDKCFFAVDIVTSLRCGLFLPASRVNRVISSVGSSCHPCDETISLTDGLRWS